MAGSRFARDLMRVRDRVVNWLRGARRPHWCSVHQRSYNSEVFRTCPECFKEQGAFYDSGRRR